MKKTHGDAGNARYEQDGTGDKGKPLLCLPSFGEPEKPVDQDCEVTHDPYDPPIDEAPGMPDDLAFKRGNVLAGKGLARVGPAMKCIHGGEYSANS